MTRNELILSAATQVEGIAATIHKKISRRVELSDLVQMGTIGAIKAADAFDPSHGAKFGTYAEYRIRGAILDGLRQNSGLRRTRLEDSDDDLLFDVQPKRRKILSLDASRKEEVIADRGDIERDLLANERSEWLARSMQSLKPRQRRVLERMIDGVPAARIAEAEHVSKSAVWACRSGAIARLRRMAATA